MKQNKTTRSSLPPSTSRSSASVTGFLRLTVGACVVAGSLLTPATAGDEWKGWGVAPSLTVGTLESSVSAPSGTRTLKSDSAAFVGLTGGYTSGAWKRPGENEGFRFGADLGFGVGDVSEKASDPDLGVLESEAQVHLSLLGRAGYSWDHLWVYGLAGIAGSDFVVHAEGDDDDTLLATGTLGLGAEYRFGDHLGLRSEILWSQEGDTDETFDDDERTVSGESSLLRFGVQWRF